MMYDPVSSFLQICKLIKNNNNRSQCFFLSNFKSVYLTQLLLSTVLVVISCKVVGGVGEDSFSKGQKSSFLKLLVDCRNKKKINYARIKNSTVVTVLRP